MPQHRDQGTPGMPGGPQHGAHGMPPQAPHPAPAPQGERAQAPADPARPPQGNEPGSHEPGAQDGDTARRPFAGPSSPQPAAPRRPQPPQARRRPDGGFGPMGSAGRSNTTSDRPRRSWQNTADDAGEQREREYSAGRTRTPDPEADERGPRYLVEADDLADFGGGRLVAPPVLGEPGF